MSASKTPRELLHPRGTAKYRHLTDEEQAQLTTKELAAYDAERARFDEEVEKFKEQIARNGYKSILR